jgi:hypothetical protein
MFNTHAAIAYSASGMHGDHAELEKKIMKRILALAALALATVAPAYALTHDEEAIIVNGIDFHGSAVCNPSWLDRPAATPYSLRRGLLILM